MRRFVPALLLAAGLFAGAAPAQAAVTRFEGQFQCDDRGTVGPLPGAEIQLWGRGWDWFPVEVTGGIADRGHTAADGGFALTSAEGEDNYFVRMALRDDAGVRLKDFVGINDWSIDSSALRNTGGTKAFGGLLLSTPDQSHKCAIWRGFHFANDDYTSIMGAGPPTGGLLVKADAITAGVPFTLHTEVSWPSGYSVGGDPGSDTVPRHEYAHAFRHAFDGDYGHFLGDVVAHGYARSHEACLRTGPGFAFNEGWAEYWAQRYAPAPECPGIPADDFDVEGNVASALTTMERDCFFGSRRKMVEVLAANRMAIHSFADFRARAVCDVRAVLSPAPERIRTAAEPVRLTPQARANLSRRQAGTIARAVDDLTRRLAAAQRRVPAAPPCKAKPCDAAFKAATEPDALRMKLALTRITLTQAKAGDTAKEQLAFDKLPVKTLASRTTRRESVNRKQAAKIVVRALSDALRHAKPLFAQDTSPRTKQIRTRMTAALAEARNSAKAGTPVDLAIGDPTTKTTTPKVVPVKAFPNPVPPSSQVLIPAPTPVPANSQPTPAPTPTPTPTPDPRTATTLSRSCPATGKAGTYAISGTISPAINDAFVTLEVTSPQGQATTQTAKTNANGFFTTGVEMQQPGTWTIRIRFGGDLTARPADADPCGILIGL